MNKLKDKVIWITGASSGIGEELAYQLAEQGATVIISARRKDKLVAIKAECVKRFDANMIVYPLDVSDPNEIKRAVDHLSSKLKKIDVLVNSAGFGHTGYFIDYDFSKAEQMFKVNVLGLMYMSQLVALKMIPNNSGQIVNISSIAGKIATPKSSIYAATKHAVTGFSNALRLELKEHNIDVTTINPGPVETAFFDVFDPNREYVNSIRPFVLEVEEVASKTVKAIASPKREVNMPFILEVANRVYTLFPKTGDYLTRTIFNKK